MKIEDFLKLTSLKDIETAFSDFMVFERRANKKRIFYLRLYTYVVRAAEDFQRGKIRSCGYNIRIVRKFAGDCEFSREKPYAERIKNICDSILNDLKKPRSRDNEMHKTKVLFRTAQGICVLRMLKI